MVEVGLLSAADALVKISQLQSGEITRAELGQFIWKAQSASFPENP